MLSARAVGDTVELHVTDDGAGFPPGFVDRAFDRFSRADEARGRGGTGLGLAIVELIARAHGGTRLGRDRARAAAPTSGSRCRPRRRPLPRRPAALSANS